MKSIIISILLFTLASTSYAQKEANWWYFGQRAGLNFSNLQTATSSTGLSTPDMPTPVVGPIITSEGSFTISNSDGDLLMSGDGMTIYNRNGVAMPNGTGMFGNESSTQSGIIVPVPGSNSQFYAISVVNNNLAAGITYSIVDMSLNGGLGDVTDVKNVQILAGPTDENITATRKKNSPNFWLIHRYLTGTTCNIHVWEITPVGIENHQSYIFSVVPPAGTFYNNFGGYLKTSPDGTKLIGSVSGGDINRCGFITAVFNPSTGVPSAVKFRNPNTAYSNWYNAEFSPSGKNLFISATNYSPEYNYVPINQITWNDLRNTAKRSNVIDDNIIASSLQLSPDGRIYGVSRGNKRLAVIMNPEEDYTSADLRLFPDYLLNTAGFGLPNFMSSFFVADILGKSFACMGNSAPYGVEITMTGTTEENAVRLIWDFGDGSATVEQPVLLGITQYQQSHTFAAKGDYTITVTPYKSDNTALTALTLPVQIQDCCIMTNRMIRTKLINSTLQEKNSY